MSDSQTLQCPQNRSAFCFLLFDLMNKKHFQTKLVISSWILKISSFFPFLTPKSSFATPERAKKFSEVVLDEEHVTIGFGKPDSIRFKNKKCQSQED